MSVSSVRVKTTNGEEPKEPPKVSSLVALFEGMNHPPPPMQRSRSLKIDVSGLRRSKTVESLASPTLENSSSSEGRLLTLISPRRANSRSYIELKIERTLPWESVPKTENKKKLEDQAFDHMRKVWKATDKSPLTITSINQEVNRVCQREMDALFINGGDPFSSELQVTENSRTLELIKIIQKGGAILLPLVNRFKIFQQALLEFIEIKKKTTDEINKILFWLKDLLLVENYGDKSVLFGVKDGRDMVRFLTVLDQIEVRVPKKFQELLVFGFGDEKNIRNDIVEMLKKWCYPKGFEMAIIKNHVHNMSWKNVAALNIKNIQHHWEESPIAQYPLNKITPEEIKRCLLTSEGVIFHHCKINGEIFYDESGSNRKEHENPEGFFTKLFEMLYTSGLNRNFPKHLIQQEAKQFVQNANQCQSLPLDVLRLIANNCWLRGHDYILELFPGLFAFPFWCRAVGLLGYEIEVKNPQNYTVKLSRTYGVYRIEKEGSTFVDKTKPLGMIHFYWMVTFSGGKYTAYLVADPNIPQETLVEERWKILNAMIHCKDFSQYQAKPGDPKRYSSPQPNHRN